MAFGVLLMLSKFKDKEIYKQLVEDYINGMSYREVGNKYNISHKSVMYYVKKQGFGRTKKESFKLESKKLQGIRRSFKTEFKSGLKPWNKGIKWLEMTGKNHPNFGKIAYWIKGNKNPNWNGGITKLSDKIRHSLKYKNWRTGVFEKDNYTCQICHQVGKELHAHHKINFSYIIKMYFIKNLKDALNCKLLFNIYWGITLCKKCHKELHPQMGI